MKAAAKSPPRRVVELGAHIVSDSGRCHGAVTFRGTRVLVADALEMLADGMTPEAICAAFNNWFTPDAVREAVRLAKDRFLDAQSHERPSRRRAARAA